MALAPRLDLRQAQTLVMTPQMQQAIKMLALSNVEIEAFIADEVARNPLLELAADDSDRAPPSNELSADVRVPEAPLVDAVSGSDRTLDIDTNAETYQNDAPGDVGYGADGALGLNNLSGREGGQDGEGFDFDSIAAATPSLYDLLATQAEHTLSGTDLRIARFLIDQIDEAGYLTMGLLDVAQRLGVPKARVEAVLTVVQGFEPMGVGARSLAECLALQLRERDRFDPAMARLVDNLDLLAAGKLTQLKRICGVDDEDLSDMIREIRALNPKPGLDYQGERALGVTPDIFVRETPEGWQIEVNSMTLPRVLVNRGYYQRLNAQSANGTKSWLNEALADAHWLVRALDQRQRTIIKVATEIVKHQDGFFRYGVAHLKPLTLKMVAEAIEMHESTVSRVTTAKYLSCARGVFELKYFFSNAVGGDGETEGASATAVRDAIKQLIAAEAPDAILSDDQLVDLLRAQGFDIARRTVAKYREALGLGSSVQRRRAAALGPR